MASNLVVRKTSAQLAADIARRLALPAWEQQKMSTLRHATLLAIARALDADHAPVDVVRASPSSTAGPSGASMMTCSACGKPKFYAENLGAKLHVSAEDAATCPEPERLFTS